MKKILITGNFRFPNLNASGSRVLGNGYLLKKLGYDVFYIGIDNNLPSDSILKGTKNSNDDFIYYNLPYPAGLKDWVSYKKRFNEVISLIKDEDLFAVIIYSSPTISLFGKLLRKWCTENKILFITDCVDWLSVGSGGLFFRFVKFIDTTYQKRILNSSADGVIAISSFLSKYYSSRGCETVVIPPLVSLKHYKKLYEIKKNKNENVNLIYVGQPFPTDGRLVKESSYKDRLDKVITVLYKLKDFNFVFNIYGLSNEQYLQVIPEQKKLIDVLEDKIKFHGHIENSIAKRKIAESDFTILFRDKNRMTNAGFPTKFVETISCGTPIITTKTSDLEKYLVEGKNGFFVDIENSDNLLKKMTEILLLDKDSIIFMKKYCKESELFSYNNYINKMEIFLNSIS